MTSFGRLGWARTWEGVDMKVGHDREGVDMKGGYVLGGEVIKRVGYD